jgi:hypothetical protein
MSPSEFIQAGGKRALCSEIHMLINSVWIKEELSEQWKESLIVHIYMNDNKSVVSGGITVINYIQNCIQHFLNVSFVCRRND